MVKSNQNTVKCESSKTIKGMAMSFTNEHLYFDDVEVNQEWVTAGRTITQTDVVNFAGVSGDFNPIHMDHQFAATTPFKQPIAHGLAVLSIASGLGVHVPLMRTLAVIQIKDWHFKEPVFFGDTIKVHCKVLEKQVKSRGRRGVISWERKIINQHGKIVQEGITLTLVEGRGLKPNSADPSAE